MPRTPTPFDQAALYEAALQGLELQRTRLEEQIRMVRSLIDGKKTKATPAPEAAAEARKGSAARKAKGKSRRKRNLSPEARARIAEAQRKRWATFRGETES